MRRSGCRCCSKWMTLHFKIHYYGVTTAAAHGTSPLAPLSCSRRLLTARRHFVPLRAIVLAIYSSLYRFGILDWLFIVFSELIFIENIIAFLMTPNTFVQLFNNLMVALALCVQQSHRQCNKTSYFTVRFE